MDSITATVFSIIALLALTVLGSVSQSDQIIISDCDMILKTNGNVISNIGILTELQEEQMLNELQRKKSSYLLYELQELQPNGEYDVTFERTEIINKELKVGDVLKITIMFEDENQFNQYLHMFSAAVSDGRYRGFTVSIPIACNYKR